MQDSNNLPTKQEQSLQSNPFAVTKNNDHVNAGTVEIEAARAVAEAQGKLVIAKKFPRSQEGAYAEMIKSCGRYNFADQAMYSFPRGGQVVTGPSIRMAEELVRNWGNIEFGTKELSRRPGESEMEAYAWDLETNNYRSIKFTVKHLRDKKGGAVPLTDERDIYELTANMGGRRLRACLLTILPADYVDDAVKKCRETLAKGKDDETLTDRVKKMLVAFQTYGVTGKMIEERIGKPTTEVFPENLAELISIYNSIRDGQSVTSDWFGGENSQDLANKPTIDSLKKKVEESKEKPKAETKAETVTKTTPAENTPTQVIKKTEEIQAAPAIIPPVTQDPAKTEDDEPIL